MYGLRKVNNTYTPNGSGRDCIIFFDQGFRGGKVDYTRFNAHPGAPSVSEYKRGPNNRNEWQAFPSSSLRPDLHKDKIKVGKSIQRQRSGLIAQRIAVESEHRTLAKTMMTTSTPVLPYVKQTGTAHPAKNAPF